MTDVQSVASPNSNKTMGSGAGGLSGGILGTGLVALITVWYPNLPPVEAAAVGALVTAVLGAVGTYLAPLLTAVQHRAVLALDGGAPPDVKTVEGIAKAQAVVAAASTMGTKS